LPSAQPLQTQRQRAKMLLYGFYSYKNVLMIRIMEAFFNTLVVGKLVLLYGFIKRYTQYCYGDRSKKKGITEYVADI
jgi:hypothetical protein